MTVLCPDSQREPTTVLSPDPRRDPSPNSCLNDNVSISGSGSDEISSCDSSLFDSAETSTDPRLDSARELLNEPFFAFEELEEDVLIQPPKLLLIELLDELLSDWIPKGLCVDPRRDPDVGVEALDCD